MITIVVLWSTDDDVIVKSPSERSRQHTDVNLLTASRLDEISRIYLHQTPLVDIPKLRNISDILLKNPTTDCAAIVNDSDMAMTAAIIRSEEMSRPRQRLPLERSTNEYLHQASDNCTAFLNDYGFITERLSEEELDFPIAFSILAHRDAEQVVRLLRAVYRPHNFHCVHIDVKAGRWLVEVLTSVVKCLTNTFIASQRVDVMPGSYSVITAELLCLIQLWRYRTWRYFINLTGEDFPLKTNYELVKILKVYNGTDDILPPTHFVYTGSNLSNRSSGVAFSQNMTNIRGSSRVVISRTFVDLILHSKRSKQLQRALRATWWFSDELFYSTLNNNSHMGIPGSYAGMDNFTLSTEPSIKTTSFARYAVWRTANITYPCASHNTEDGICLLSVGDLPRMAKSPAMFAQKFHLAEDRVAIDCLEQILINRTREYYRGVRSFSTDVYRDARIVMNMMR